MSKPRKGPARSQKIVSLSAERHKRLTLLVFDEMERESRRQSKDKEEAVRKAAKDAI